MVLYEDLKKGNLDTLSKYVVEWKHVSCDGKTHLILNYLEKYLIHQMCKKYADGVKLQCIREYWDDDEKPRATQLHKHTEYQRKNLPNNNL